METCNTTDWNDERKERLEELYREGFSFSLIAADIGVSRNAAIGKARRMQLPKRVEVYTVRAIALTARPPPRRRRRSKACAMNEAQKPRRVFTPEPGRDYRCTIYDLRNSSCRFPMWAVNTPHPDRLYCGVPAASLAAGTPYCPLHTAVSLGNRQF